MKRFFAAHKLLEIYCISVLIFSRGIVHPFFQDDFIKIYLGWFDSFSDVLNLFQTYSRYPFLAFRPITDSFFGFIILYVFHLNAVWTHAVFFLVHGLNLLLLQRLLNQFIENKKIVLLSVFFYAVSSIHFGTLYWLTANYMLFGTCILLSILTLIMKYRRTMHAGHIAGISFLYLLLLLSNEGLLLFPFLLLFLHRVRRIENAGTLFVSLLTVSGGIFLFRLWYSPFRSLPDYALGSPLEIVRTVLWYTYRVWNIPESIKQMDGVLRMLVMLFVGFTIVLTVAGLVACIRRRSPKTIRVFMLGIAWFFLFGMPHFLLPHHLSPYYLHTAAIGFFLVQALLISQFLHHASTVNRVLLTAFCFFTMLTGFLNVHFYHTTHWIVWRASIADRYISQTKKLYPTLPKGATVVFERTDISPDEIRVALFDDIALQVYYGDRNLQVMYGSPDKTGDEYYSVSDK